MPALKVQRHRNLAQRQHKISVIRMVSCIPKVRTTVTSQIPSRVVMGGWRRVVRSIRVLLAARYPVRPVCQPLHALPPRYVMQLQVNASIRQTLAPQKPVNRLTAGSPFRSAALRPMAPNVPVVVRNMSPALYQAPTTRTAITTPTAKRVRSTPSGSLMVHPAPPVMIPRPHQPSHPARHPKNLPVRLVRG